MKYAKLAGLLALTVIMPIIPAALFFEYITSRTLNQPTFLADRFVRLFYKD